VDTKPGTDRSAATLPSVGDLGPLVTSFVRHLRAANKSEQTVTAYRYEADGLSAFVADRGMPTRADLIRREHVEAYIQDLLDTRSPATGTRGTGVSSSSSAGSSRRARSGTTRWRTCARRRSPRHRCRSSPRRGLRALLATCDGSLEGRRDEAILRVFIDTGARLAEVTDLRLDSEDEGDVDLDGGVLRVTGKGRRQRLLAIGAKTTKAVDRCVRKRVQSPYCDLP